MAKNIYGPQMAKNVYGPPMAKNIYGPPMAKNIYGPLMAKNVYGPPMANKYNGIQPAIKAEIKLGRPKKPSEWPNLYASVASLNKSICK